MGKIIGSLFSKPKTPKMPPVPPPPALPEEAPEAAEEAAKRMRSKRGYRKTLITGALTPDTGKKNLLG